MSYLAANQVASSFNKPNTVKTILYRDTEVLVLEMGATMPEKVEVLGHIKIGDTGFTTKNGNYAAVLNIARDQAY